MRRFKIHYAGKLFDDGMSGWDVVDTATGKAVGRFPDSDKARRASDFAEANGVPSAVKCRARCGWHLGHPHDQGCKGTAGRMLDVALT